MPWLPLYYGGTFDPVHRGHVAIACAARDELEVPVQLMPAADPPHRPPPGANAMQRAHMLALAIRGIDGLSIEHCELERAGQSSGRPSYTVDTVEQLRAQRHGTAPMALLIGADSLLGLPTWHDWRRLVGMVHLIVADRPGSPLDGPVPEPLATWLTTAWAEEASQLAGSPGGRVLRLRQPLHGESASQVRQAIMAAAHPEAGSETEGWRALLPAAVADYIAAQRLYGFALAP